MNKKEKERKRKKKKCSSFIHMQTECVFINMCGWQNENQSKVEKKAKSEA